MYKHIVVEPLLYKTIDNSIHYGVNIFDGSSNHEIWKTYPEFKKLEEYLMQKTFDLQPIISQHKNVKDAHETMEVVLQFILFICERKDIIADEEFIKFFNFTPSTHELISEFSTLKIANGGNLIDLCWQPKTMTMITLHQNKKIIEKMTSLIKTIFTNKQTNEGSLRIYKMNNSNWELKEAIMISGCPLSVKWNRKTSLLHVCTNIGIMIYSLNFDPQIRYQLISFIKEFQIKDYCFEPINGGTYLVAQSMLKVHSLNKQFIMDMNTQPIPDFRCMCLQEPEHRLFVCQQETIQIYNVAQLKEPVLLAKLRIDTSYDKLKIYHEHMLGLCKGGYVSVFELKAKGKQKLISVLTNLDCPENSKCMVFSHKHQILFTQKGEHIVIISSKNEPLLVGGCEYGEISTISYDQESNMMVCGSVKGVVVLYNLSIDLSV